MRKLMLKRGAQKGGAKGENKWLDVHLEWAGAVQTLFATFHENSKYHRKCLYFGSHIRSFFVPFSSLFPQSGQRGPGPRPKVPKVHQNGSQGCQNGGLRFSTRPTRRQTVPHGSQNGGPGATMEAQGHPKCEKETTRPLKVPLQHQNVPQGV